MLRPLKFAMILLPVLMVMVAIGIANKRRLTSAPELTRQPKAQVRPEAPSHKPGDEAQLAFPEGTPALKALGRPDTRSHVSQEDREADELRLTALRNSKNEIVRISNEVHAPGISFTIDHFSQTLLKYGDGVRILSAISVPDRDSEDRLMRLLKDAGSLPLNPANEINFFPVRIMGRDGTESRAWLLSSQSLKKTSMFEDGLPAGIHPGEEAMAYKRHWCLLAMDDPPPLRALAWFSTFERDSEKP